MKTGPIPKASNTAGFSILVVNPFTGAFACEDEALLGLDDENLELYHVLVHAS